VTSGHCQNRWSSPKRISWDWLSFSPRVIPCSTCQWNTPRPSTTKSFCPRSILPNLIPVWSATSRSSKESMSRSEAVNG